MPSPYTVIGSPNRDGEVFNVGHTKEIAICELAVMIKKVTQSSSEIVFIPYEKAYVAGFEDMPRRMPDISKIQRLVGYEPSLDLPEMVDRIIAYERARLPVEAQR